jgi:integrase/recombinase XerD
VSTEPLITAHLNYLRLAGFRPKTVKARGQVLDAFTRSLAPHPLLEATRLQVEAYLARPLAPESRRTYRSHLRSYFAWCIDEGYLHDDPTARIPAVRVKRGTPRPLPDDDLNRAVDLADRRMRAWLLCMALAGLRCLEVAVLRPSDLLDTPAGPILYLTDTKGGGTATVPAHPAVVEALAVVPIRNGLWWSVTPETLSRQVNRHLRASGVAGTAHQLRHWAGTSWFRASGHDLLTVATLMRHASVDTSTIYTKLDPSRPSEVVRAVTLRKVPKPATNCPLGA